MNKPTFNVLRTRDFRLLMFARMFAAMALQAQDVIAGWQIYSLTHSPFMLGLAGLTEALPAIACALFAGHIVDTHKPYRVFLYCIVALTCNMLVLLLVAGGIVSVWGGIVPWIFSGIFISGVARSFIMPSSYSLLAQVVPRRGIASASAYFSSSYQFAAISGPAIVGIVYGVYGACTAWILPMSFMLISFLTLCSMETGIRLYKGSQIREPAAQSIKAGWQFILRNPVLLSVMALDMFAVLFGGAQAMLPVYADKILHVGSEGLGTLRAAGAIGAVITAGVLAVRPFKDIHATTLLWAVAGFGVCIIGFGLSTSFWLSLFLLALSGAFDSVSMVIRGTLMQLLTPDAMRGRVSSVNSMFIISSNEIGAFESGVAATWLGLVPSVVFGGMCTLTIVGITAWLSPKLRHTIVSAEETENT